MAFIAELHDVIKLLDRQSLNPALELQGYEKLKSKTQSFEGIRFNPATLPEPTSLTWKTIIRHEGDNAWNTLKNIDPRANNEEIESRRQRFVTTLADHFASSIARGKPSAPKSNTVKKVWGTEANDLTLKDTNSFEALLSFLASDPTWDQFKSRYHEQLRSIPEEKAAPFTSLYNHLSLTGKIARVLLPQVQLELRGSEWFAIYHGTAVQSVDEAHGTKKTDTIGRWKFSLVKVWAEIPQYIVRLQDLSVLGDRQAAFIWLSEKHYDNVLYFTDDSALTFWTEFNPSIFEGFSDFQWKFRVIESDLTTMSSALDTPGNFDSEKARRHGARVYEDCWPPDFPDVINGPLCPVCQMKQATEEWEKGTLAESLCTSCLGRRKRSPSAARYANWDELGIDVAWIKLSVWPELVQNTVCRLFADEAGGSPETLQEFRSISLEMDFLDDYAKLLREWRTSIDIDIPAEQMIQPVSNYPELAILRLDRTGLWSLVVEHFCKVLAKIMPKLMEEPSGNQCPIQISIDISTTKYPFHEHWRYFRNPGPMAVNIRDSRRSIELSFSPSNFQKIIGLSRSVEYRSSLHELAELFEVTRSRAAVLLAAWERRTAIEKQLRSSTTNILEWVQLARLLGQ